MRRSAISYLLLAVLMGGLLASCGNDETEGDRGGAGDAAPATLPDGMGSTAAEGEFPRTMKHFGGESEIPKEPVRVAILSTGQLDATLSLGVVPVAAARADDAGLVPEYLPKAFPDDADRLAEIVDLGTRKEPDLEKLAAAKPDLILANEQGFETMIDEFNQIAPTVLSEGEGVNWAQDLLIVAAALGKSDRAQQLIDDIDAQARAVGETAGDQTFSFVRFQEDRTRIFGVGSFVGSLAERANLMRPESQRFPETSQDVSLETPDLFAGDWVFFATPDGKPGDAPPQALTQGSGAKPEQMISVNEDTWFLNAGPAAARTVLDEIAAAIE